MSNYTAEFEPFYTNGWENQPSENTPIMGEALDKYDSTLVKIEKFLSNLDLSGLGADYALLTEAGYSLNLSVDKNYVLTIDLLNKAGTVLSSKNVDLPLETMFINATYANGVITLTLQNGNTLDVDISDIVRGLVPTSRTIAGIDLEDDVTKEELQNALEIYDSTVMGGELKPWLYDTEKEVVVGVYNGKPLYRKYFQLNVVTINGLVEFNISDYVPNYENIINHKMYTISGNILNEIHAQQGTTDMQNWICYFVNKGSGKIQVTCSLTMTELDYVFTCMFEYTKTTDAEGSGNNLNPYGIYSAKLDEVKADIEELQNSIVTTDSTTLSNSHAGRVKFNSIVGGMEQGENPSPDNPQEIESSVISGVRVHWKNLLNPDTAINNKYQNNSNYGYVISNNAEYWISDFIPVEEGQIISTNPVASEIAVYDINKSGIAFYHNLVQTITIPSGGKYAVFCYPKSRVEFGADVMVCEGTDATFEPYQSKEITLSNPITLYNDVLGENVGRKYKKVVFDGSNYPVKKQTIGGYERFYIHNLLKGKKQQSHGEFSDLLVSHFIVSWHPVTDNSVDERACGYFQNDNLYIRCDRFTTVEEFNAYFAENPMTVVFAIEPTTEELPTIDRIALNSLPTYDGITYVEFVNVGVQPSVSIDYGTSKIGGMTLESLLTARNNDLRLSSLEASVVNNI